MLNFETFEHIIAELKKITSEEDYYTLLEHYPHILQLFSETQEDRQLKIERVQNELSPQQKAAFLLALVNIQPKLENTEQNISLSNLIIEEWYSGLITSAHAFINIIKNLPESQQRRKIFAACKNCLSKNYIPLSMVITNLSLSTGIEFLNLCVNSSIKIYIHIYKVDSILSENMQYWTWNKLFKLVPALFNYLLEDNITDESMFVLLMERFDEEQRQILYEKCKPHLPSLINTTNCFQLISKQLNEEQQKDFYQYYLEKALPNVTEAMVESFRKLLLNQNFFGEELAWLKNYLGTFTPCYLINPQNEPFFFIPNIEQGFEAAVEQLVWIIYDKEKNPQDQDNRQMIFFKHICDTLDLNRLIEYLERHGQNDLIISTLKQNPAFHESEKASLVFFLIENSNLKTLKEILHITQLMKESETFNIAILNELNNALTYWSKYNPKEKKWLYEFLSIQYNLKGIMQEIKNYFTEDYKSISQLMTIYQNEENRIFFIIQRIKNFTKNFGFLEYYDALLTCAQVATRKKPSPTAPGYIFNPTIIKANELQTYLEILKTQPLFHEVRERLIITDQHWLTCDIQIKNGHINILVIESLGLKKIFGTTPLIIQTISAAFPDASLFFSYVVRQNTNLGCSAFALDDLMHLYTLESYLPEKNLFQYLLQQEVKALALTSDPNSVQVKHLELPLSLMRTMQSKDLIKTIIPNSKEKDISINKKGETAHASTAKFFKPNDEEPEQIVNTRLKKKLLKMGQRNLSYLVEHPLEEIAQAMEKHTLNGFQTRMLEESNKQMSYTSNILQKL